MTKAEQQSFLEQNLRDLQTPNVSLWWPPAVGWWIVAVLLMLLISALLYLYIRNRFSLKTNRQKNPVARQLDLCLDQWRKDNDAANYIQSVSTLLKQSAVRYAGRSSVARLNGREWIDWMELATATSFSTRTSEILGHGGYQKFPPAPDLQSHRELTEWSNNYTEIAKSRGAANNRKAGIEPVSNQFSHNA